MNDQICDNLVMVVEDDRDVRESISEVLEDHEYQPIGAANGQEAFERLRAGSHKPCVILLDIMMPIMDGWQFRALQREDPELSSIPVVVLTAHANLQEAATGMHVAACLKKPVQLKTLLATVERFCRKRSEA
jgi:CheY-like chemotaxis protein